MRSDVLVLISEVWGGFSPEAMRFLGELSQARNDGIDIERASTTWSTSSFTSYHGQLLSLAVQWGVAIEIEPPRTAGGNGPAVKACSSRYRSRGRALGGSASPYSRPKDRELSQRHRSLRLRAGEPVPQHDAVSRRTGSNPPSAAQGPSVAAMPPWQPQCGTDGPTITWHGPLQPLQFSAASAPPERQLPAEGRTQPPWFALRQAGSSCLLSSGPREVLPAQPGLGGPSKPLNSPRRRRRRRSTAG